MRQHVFYPVYAHIHLVVRFILVAPTDEEVDCLHLLPLSELAELWLHRIELELLDQLISALGLVDGVQDYLYLQLLAASQKHG